MIHDNIWISRPWESRSLSYLIHAFVDERQMFRVEHKERRRRLTVITRFRGIANREERRNWKAAKNVEAPTISLSLFFSPLPLSRLCFRTVPEADAFVRRQWRGSASPCPPSFPQSVVSFAISRHTGVSPVLINENPPTAAPFSFPFPRIRERDDSVLPLTAPRARLSSRQVDNESN